MKRNQSLFSLIIIAIITNTQLYSMEMDMGGMDMGMDMDMGGAPPAMPAMPTVPEEPTGDNSTAPTPTTPTTSANETPAADTNPATTDPAPAEMPSTSETPTITTDAANPAPTPATPPAPEKEDGDLPASPPLPEAPPLPDASDEETTEAPATPSAATAQPTASPQPIAEAGPAAELQKSMQIIGTLKKELRDLYALVNQHIQTAHTKSAQAHKFHLKMLSSTPEEAAKLETQIESIKNEITALEKELDTIKTTKIQTLSSKIDAEITKAQASLAQLSKVGIREELKEEFEKSLLEKPITPVATPAPTPQPQQTVYAPPQHKSLIHTVFNKVADLIVGTINLIISLIMKIKDLIIPPTSSVQSSEKSTEKTESSTEDDKKKNQHPAINKDDNSPLEALNSIKASINSLGKNQVDIQKVYDSAITQTSQIYQAIEQNKDLRQTVTLPDAVEEKWKQQARDLFDQTLNGIDYVKEMLQDGYQYTQEKLSTMIEKYKKSETSEDSSQN